MKDLPISGMELEGSSWSGGDAGWRRWAPAVDLRIRWPGGDFAAPFLAAVGAATAAGGGGGPMRTTLVGGGVRFEGPGLVEDETTAEALVPPPLDDGRLMLFKRRITGRNSGWNWCGLTITSIRGGVMSAIRSSFINNSGRIRRITLLCLLGGGVSISPVSCCCESFTFVCSSNTQELSGDACSLLLVPSLTSSFIDGTTVSLLSASTVDSTAILMDNNPKTADELVFSSARDKSERVILSERRARITSTASVAWMGEKGAGFISRLYRARVKVSRGVYVERSFLFFLKGDLLVAIVIHRTYMISLFSNILTHH